MAKSDTDPMSRLLPALSYLGLTMLLAASPVSALADGGRGDEATLNKQGLESVEQVRRGYANLNSAAFVLLFDENLPVTGFGHNPRGVTFVNASSTDTLHWALRRAREAYARRQQDLEKQQQVRQPKVRVETQPKGPAKPQAFRAWAEDRGGQVRPAGAVGYDPFDLTGGDGAPSASVLDAILEDATAETDTDGAPAAPLTPFWALGPRIAETSARAAPDYEAGRDAILTLIAVPQRGLYLAGEDTSDQDLSPLPGLGRVPLLGALFRNDRGGGDRTFTITVTPRIVRDYDD